MFDYSSTFKGEFTQETMEEDKMPLELSMIVSMLVGGVSSESDLNEPDVTAIAEQIMFSHRKRKRTCSSDEVCKI